MLIDSLTEFSDAQAVTVTAVGSKAVDSAVAGNAKLNELFWHARRTTELSLTNVLTMDTQPTAGDTFTIGTKVFTFVTDGTADADGEVDVGADVADAKTLVVAAINGTDGYNTASEFVTASAFATNDCTLTAIAGVAGDLAVTTETFTAVTNVFAAVSLGVGTVTFSLQTSATVSGTALSGTVVDLMVSPAVTIAAINADAEAFKARIPEGALRYIGVKYTVSSTLASGAFDSFLNADAN